MIVNDMSNISKITISVDASDVVKAIPELEQSLAHYYAVPILVQGIKQYMPSPHKEELLEAWDEARTKGGTNESNLSKK